MVPSAAIRTVRVIGASLVTVAALTACESASTHDHGVPTNASPQVQSAGFNVDDVAFAANMVPHHQQGVELSAMVPPRSTNPELLVMAQHISSDQQAEILTFHGLLAQWGQPARGHSGHTGHDVGTVAMTMTGMVDPATINQLQSLRGVAFDELWIRSMIGHHQGAIMMAQTELERGKNADARHVADMIITAQQREIAQMINLLNLVE